MAALALAILVWLIFGVTMAVVFGLINMAKRIDQPPQYRSKKLGGRR